MAVVAREKTELERLMDERRGHGWRKALAAEMGVSRQKLHAWITGRKPWPAGRQQQVCELTRLAWADIFERK